MRAVAGCAALIAASAAACSGSCGKGKAAGVDADVPLDGSIVSAPSATAPGAPRPGMVWIPSGVLKAGTPIDQVPRVAAEELPGTEVPLGGFYIDELAWPNELGAIPTTNVTHDDAAHMCTSKGKRLCTELEWERACKGPNNTRYEYGDDYRSATCATGVSAEDGAKRPSGERLACKSAFEVREMHGGPYEWTDSAWGRGGPRDLVTLRGGTAVAGEIAGRCANALGRPGSQKAATSGFRCCAGPRNDAKVDLTVTWGQPLRKLEKGEEMPSGLAALGCATPDDTTSACASTIVWDWRPAGNVDLYVKGGCILQGNDRHCGVVVGRVIGETAQVLAWADAGNAIPDVVLLQGEGRHIRMKGGDVSGAFFKELDYSYGRVDVKDAKGDPGAP
jgi:formylglycine-generating enzyme required for sulfatase activity